MPHEFVSMRYKCYACLYVFLGTVCTSSNLLITCWQFHYNIFCWICSFGCLKLSVVLVIILYFLRLLSDEQISWLKWYVEAISITLLRYLNIFLWWLGKSLQIYDSWVLSWIFHTKTMLMPRITPSIVNGCSWRRFHKSKSQI